MTQNSDNANDPVDLHADVSTVLAHASELTLDRLPRFVDTHAHLDEEAFAADQDDVIDGAVRAGVAMIVNIGFRPDRWRTTTELVRRRPELLAVIGLHPQSAADYHAGTIEEIKNAIRRSKARAVGEIGLDYHRAASKTTAAIQRHAFEAQIELAVDLGLPVVIHQRAAEQDCKDVLRAAPPSLSVLLHCFEGDRSLLCLGLDRNYSFGIGGVITRASGERLRIAVRDIPPERLLLETDAPYLTPAGVKDRRNTPANIPLIAAKLAETIGRPLVEVAATTTANANRFFGGLSAPVLSGVARGIEEKDEVRYP